MNYLSRLILVLGIALSSLLSPSTILLAEEPINQNKAYRDLRDEMSSLSQRIRAVKLENQRRLQQLKGISIDFSREEDALPPINQKLILRPKKFTEQYILPDSGVENLPEKENQMVGRVSKFGIYVLPFYSIYQSNDFHLKSPFLGNLEIEQEIGNSLGIRLGKRWRYFFIETDLNYFNEEMESLIGNPLRGETSTLSGIFSVGAQIPAGEKFSFLLGTGIGSAYQKVKFDFMGLSIPDDNNQLCYQFFTGVHINPVPNWLIGLRYRWIRFGEMDTYTDRQLHAFEISTGYEW